MASTFSDEENVAQIRERLNRDKVKLWLPPFTQDSGEKGEPPVDLAVQYSEELGIAQDTVLRLLEQLRRHALDKLTARKRLQEQGLIHLKVKLTSSSIGQDKKGTVQNIEILLNCQGQELRQKVAEHYGIDISRTKLISGGHVIEDDRSLQEQRVRHNAHVMVVCLSESEAESRRYHHQAAMLAKTRQAAELLSAKSSDPYAEDGYSLQIADQKGQSLQLPAQEKQALTLAMTLHEKGRAEMKRKDHGTGLLLLLEADKEFKKCRSEILDAVDNYAILCLDIVWCYLCLKNISDLPDAEVRLRSCEDCFIKSYGPNLERLNTVKGETGSQQALYMRLHLLQGILAYHQNRMALALSYLNTAEGELKRLQVDDEKLGAVMGMGFSLLEARLGLRSCSGDVQRTIDHIIKKREEKKVIAEKEKEKRKNEKLGRELGKTANGEWVNVDLYNNLLSMGFQKGASREALKQSNNSLTQALQVLQDRPELLTLPDPHTDHVDVTDEMIAQVTSLGFDEHSVAIALQRFSGSIQRAVEELLKVGGVAPDRWEAELSDDEARAGPSTSKKSKEQRKCEKEMIESITRDIPENEEDYLDLTLDEEAEFLQQYKSLLKSL